MGILSSAIYSNLRMKLFAALAASVIATDPLVVPDNPWKGQCNQDADGNWVMNAEMCGQKWTNFQPVNNTCTFSGGATAAVHKFLGGGAIIQSDNTFFGIEHLTSTSGDLVVFGNHAPGLCNEQWFNKTDAGYLDYCDFGGENAVTCTPTVGGHPGYYFMETVNSHKLSKDASYNFQFWAEPESSTHQIYDYINETAGKVPTENEPSTYTVDHVQYNNKIFTASLSNSDGGNLAIANCSCIKNDCDITWNNNVVTITTGSPNSELYDFSCFVSGDEIPDLWTSSITAIPRV